MNKESLFRLGLGIATVAIGAELSQWAFSLQTRNKIRDRAREKFGFLASEIDGTSGVALEACHIDHDRSHPHYNDPDNGILATVPQHLIDHIQRHGRNGLSEAGNIWAIGKLKERVIDEYGEDYLYELLSPHVAGV